MISHLALIMDGNRRWAKKRSWMPWQGHRQGAESVKMAIQYCLDQGISYLSLYTFSLENFNRSEKEVSYLFALIKEAKNQIDQFIETGVSVRFVGDRSKVPADVKVVCEEIEEKTKNGVNLQCNFLFCYGAQQEIITAVKELVKKPNIQITLDIVKQHLWLGNIPDPEVIIRTGGVKRLSNFLLFQAAYSEIRFLDCFWPDLDRDTLHEVVLDCINSQKNLGK